MLAVAIPSHEQPITLRMAKDQDLPVASSRITGLCGRLRCCLAFEHPTYKSFRDRAPRVGRRVETPQGVGVVTGYTVLEDTCTVELEGEELAVEIAIDECRDGRKARSASGKSSGGSSSARVRADMGGECPSAGTAAGTLALTTRPMRCATRARIRRCATAAGTSAASTSRRVADNETALPGQHRATSRRSSSALPLRGLPPDRGHARGRDVRRRPSPDPPAGPPLRLA